MSRSSKLIASDLFEDGWLTPNAAASALGITVEQLEARAKRGLIRRRQIAPNTPFYLYDVKGAAR